MGIKRLVSQHCVIEPYGKVNLVVRSNAVNVTARWHGDVLHVTLPPIDERRLREALAGMQSRIMARKPAYAAPAYHDGYTFIAEDWFFVVTETESLSAGRAEAIKMHADDGGYRFNIRYGTGSDIQSDAMQQAIGRLVKTVARHMAERLLLPQAHAEAVRLGIAIPAGHISVGRGRRRLGCCTGRGRISLSYVLMFADTETRRSIITHELAHLRHFNHSPEFYVLWDSYLGYRHLCI